MKNFIGKLIAVSLMSFFLNDSFVAAKDEVENKQEQQDKSEKADSNAKEKKETPASDANAKNKEKKQTEIGQKELFNMIRKGVVAIKVLGHVIMERTYNEKMWSGTGFIADKDTGLIVTNAHVAGEMQVCTYEVKFGNGTKAEAKLKYIDPCYDIAILKVDPSKVPSDCITLEMSDDEVTVNTAVYAMGNSLGNEFSTYPGTIFDTHSILWLRPFPEQSMQFSGLTVPGASGSPVFRNDGQVIGLLYGGKFASGAALPIKYVKPVVQNIKKEKKYNRYFFGFMLEYMTIQDAIEAGMVPAGVEEAYNKNFPDSNNKVLYVPKKLTAFIKGTELEAGDVLKTVNGVEIGCNLQKLDEIIQKNPGESLTCTVYRNGKEKEVKISSFKMPTLEDLKLLSFAGATFFETSGTVKMLKGDTKKGVYITNCEPGSPFMDVVEPSKGSEYSGFRGLVQITSINGHKIKDLKGMADALPDILKKDILKITFIKMIGDGQEESITAKYSPAFADADLCTFDNKENKWQLKRIENPANSQGGN